MEIPNNELNFEQFSAILQNSGLERFISEKNYADFCVLAEKLQQFNSITNITAIKDIRGIALKHYADSLTAEKYIKPGAVVADIGCGGGFPSLPLAMLRPDIKILAVDSVAKKLEFINIIKSSLGLDNIEIYSGRAEEMAVSYRESFDVVTARAVAALNILDELCLPLVRVGGIFLAMKGKGAELEITAAEKGIALLGGDKPKIYEGTVSDGEEIFSHSLIITNKIKATDTIYPRMYPKIIKKPL